MTIDLELFQTTTRRVRPVQQDTKNTRKRHQTTTTRRRNSTVQRRGSQYQEVQVAMLPDLSQDLTDEERIWEEIHEIKTMPVSMAQKKEMKAQLQNATKLRLQGLDQFKWQRRKAWQQLETKWSELLTKMELWRNSLKKIEGNFGTGVVAYFLFLRWLMVLNLVIFSLILIFIVIPQIVYVSKSTSWPKYEDSPNCNASLFNDPESQGYNSTECCYENYLNSAARSYNQILDIIQGTGFMEKTLMFYGMYSNKIFGYVEQQPSSLNETDSSSNFTIESSSKRFYYDLPLAYVSITAVYFLLSLAAIVKSASKEFKDRLVDGEGQFYQYCNLIFGGWDFCIHNEKSADIKHKALYNEIKGLLHTKQIEYERCNRSKDYMCKLIVIRFFINIAVLIILALAAVFIYYFFNISLEFLEKKFEVQESSNYTEKLWVLFFEFLPYLAIVCLNLLVPILFNYLVEFEKYSPMFVIKISLFRTVFLRLSSLAVLLSRFYFLIIPKNEIQCYEKQTSKPQCWETYIGQQFYKLVITDFGSHIFVTFFVNFPRSLFAKHMRTKFARLVGEQEFELSKHVLDVVYSQTLCWLGSFYSPFLPAISTVITFFMFYIKKFQCLVNSKPSAILYRASRSNSLFMLILLISFVVAVIPVVYSIAEIMPSRSCGPFRGRFNVWEAAIEAFEKMPSFFRSLIFFLGTAGFAIPCFIVLALFLYYYYAVSDANKHMVEVLKNQLVLEGHDKQFLLHRLSTFIKQQQEFQKKMRHFDNPPNNQHQKSNDRHLD
ncbi:TMC7 family protein [Megaselia abdita]